MKSKFPPLFLIIIFLFQCKEEECHKELIFKNQSSQMVILALTYHKSGTNICGFDTFQIAAKSNHTLYRRNCWEEDPFYNVSNYLHFFYFDTLNYPKDFGAYDLIPCDSIYQKFRVLKEYKLTLEDLQKNNFSISYP